MDQDKLEQLAELFREYPGAPVLTGAGLSTESGIPDFRSPGGLYSQIDPMEYLSTDALYGHPKRFWKYFGEVFGPVLECAPNAGHIALARLEEAGLVGLVATQNIDGLHQKAGSRYVLELHGNLRACRCEHCSTSHTLRECLAQLERRPEPLCKACAKPVRPDVVLFGDMLPRDFTEALAAAKQHPFLLVVGSSLMVSPANTLAFEARRLVIINRDETLADDRAELVLHGSAGALLTALADLLLGKEKTE